MGGQLVFITPTYERDYERFCLQRESIERCGIDIPHVAIVDHEDLSAFEALPFRKNLTLVSTRDILEPAIEARRTARGYPRRNPLHWARPKPIAGWMVQQLIKLAAVSKSEADAAICLDSDTFFVDRVQAGDFYQSDGRLHLYETDNDLDAEMAEWAIASLRLLGVRLWKQPLKRYTHALVPVKCSVVRNMQDFLQAKYGRPWADVMLSHKMIFEYSTYGAYARHIHGLEGLAPTTPSLCAYYWWPEQAETIEQDFAQRVEASHAKAVLVNSNIGRPVASYRALAEELWKRREVASLP